MAGVMSVGAVFAEDADPGMACCGMMPGMMGARRGEMMEWHQKMMEKIKAQDAEMDKLVQEMNAATGEKKVEAIAAVINKAMEIRKGWHSEMEARQKKMMDWMKEKAEAIKGKKGMKKEDTAPKAP